MEVNVRWLGCQGPGFHEKGKEWKLCQGGVQIWKKNMKKYTGEQFMCGVTAAKVGSIDKRTKRRIGCNRRVWSCEDGEEKMVA